MGKTLIILIVAAVVIWSHVEKLNHLSHFQFLLQPSFIAR